MRDSQGIFDSEDLEFPDITELEVERAIKYAPAGKALDDDAILNRIFYQLVPILLPYITPLFNTHSKLRYNSSHY